MAKNTNKMSKEFKENFIKEHGKKAFDEFCKAQRTTVGFNTGTRTHKSPKDYQRNPKHKNSKFDY